jgi:hypothetical protein
LLPENAPIIDYKGPCKIDPDGDLDDDARWRKVLGIHCFITHKALHEIFDDPNWIDTIMFDLDMSMHFWNEIYSPMLSGQRSH